MLNKNWLLVKNWALSYKWVWTLFTKLLWKWMQCSACGLLRKLEYPESIWPWASLYSCAYPCCEVKPLGSGGRAWTGWPVVPTTQEQPASRASILHVPNHQVPFQDQPPLWNCRAAKIIIAVFPHSERGALHEIRRWECKVITETLVLCFSYPCNVHTPLGLRFPSLT